MIDVGGGKGTGRWEGHREVGRAQGGDKGTGR